LCLVAIGIGMLFAKFHCTRHVTVEDTKDYSVGRFRHDVENLHFDKYNLIGSRPSDHYFRSVCLFAPAEAGQLRLDLLTLDL